MPLRLLLLIAALVSAEAAIEKDAALLWLDFESETASLSLRGQPKIVSGKFGRALEYDSILQSAELQFPKLPSPIEEFSIGGWFYIRRTGEQYFFSRGLPKTAPGGERVFPREQQWINFVLGTDHRGFLLGTINGNGGMPFPLVTIEELIIDQWHQLVCTKDSHGVHRFYHNGALVHTDANAANRPRPHPFNESAEGQPVRLMMPLGGRMGEAWIFPRVLTAEEIASNFDANKERYNPALPPSPVKLREMNAHYAAQLWKTNLTAASWPKRARIEAAARSILGTAPTQIVPLDPKLQSEEDFPEHRRRKISIQVQPNDQMPFWMLLPKNKRGKTPVVICFYGTSGGTGKDSVVGLTGREPGSAPHANMSFAQDLVRAGFIAVAADYLRDGERIKPGKRPYDTTDFYKQFPDWSIHGKDAWDTQRLIDYLVTLEFVDSDRIGMTGHSYGGHSTIFTAAIEPRIKVAVANGPVSDFLHHGMHWAVPAGAGASQSMPALRPYVLDHTKPLPVTFYEFIALIAPRPLLVGQAVGERRPMEEENYAAVKQAYDALGAPQKVRHHWYAGDHDFPPEARAAMVEWFRRWFAE
jgi:dienelactone hydrolase